MTHALLFFAFWTIVSLPFAAVLLAINAMARRKSTPEPVQVFKRDAETIAATCGAEPELAPWEGPNEFAPCDCSNCIEPPFAG